MIHRCCMSSLLGVSNNKNLLYLPTQLSEADIELVSSACRLLIAAVVVCKRKADGHE